MQENENATHIYYLHWLLYIDAATILLFNTNFSPRTATADANYSDQVYDQITGDHHLPM